jgi:DNA-binding response OmpR family regulator
MKILLAEDEPASRLALEATVQQWGFEPVPAEDGHRALEILAAPDAPRIAILDWMMPQMDGTDVCKAIRAASLPVEPYLLILTTRANRADVVAGLQAGADDYVTKPFDRVELQARLQVGLRIIRLQTQLIDRLRELEEGRARERSLERMLPICAYCR